MVDKSKLFAEFVAERLKKGVLVSGQRVTRFLEENKDVKAETFLKDLQRELFDKRVESRAGEHVVRAVLKRFPVKKPGIELKKEKQEPTLVNLIFQANKKPLVIRTAFQRSLARQRDAERDARLFGRAREVSARMHLREQAVLKEKRHQLKRKRGKR